MSPSGTARVRRAPVLVALAVLAVGGGLADRAIRPAVATQVSLAPSLPTAAPTSALSSAWYCPGAPGPPGATAAGQLVLANAGSRPVAGTITAVTGHGAPRTQPVAVAARSQLVVPQAQLGEGPSGAATVQLAGGGVGVEEVVTGQLGRSAAPCASATSQQWYLATGSTIKGNVLTLALFNPTASYAVADLTFATDQGPASPGDFQGIEVPADGLVTVDVGAHVQDRTGVATTVSARIGRLVVGQLELASGAAAAPATAGPGGAPASGGASVATAPAAGGAPATTAPGGGTAQGGAPATAGYGVAGMALSLGAPMPGTRWSFPAGQDGGGTIEGYHVYNPSGRVAEVSLALGLDAGSAEPFQLTVGPQQELTLVANSQLRVPQKVGHDAVVTATNGVPVVAVRTVAATAPAAGAGRADLLGSPHVARRWVLPGGEATSATDLEVAVQDPGPDPGTVSVSSLAGGVEAPVPGLTGLPVASGGRLSLRIGDHLTSPSVALVVQASVPVVVESDQYQLKGPGVSASLGIPLS